MTQIPFPKITLLIIKIKENIILLKKKQTCRPVKNVILTSSSLKSRIYHDILIVYKNLTTRCCTTTIHVFTAAKPRNSLQLEVRLVWYTNNNVIQVEVAAFSTSTAFCRVFETTEWLSHKMWYLWQLPKNHRRF